MKILVTGANSFIGTNIVKELLKNKYDIIALDLSFRQRDLNLKQIIINKYNDYSLCSEKTDVLIHLAWMGTTQEQRINEEIQRQNYEISLAMADKAFKFGCKRFILAGSQAEYGPHNNELITEDSSITPNTAYGKYKNKLFESLRKKYPDKVIIDARIFSCYGPFQNKNQMVPAIVEKMIKGENCKFTPASQLWNYIYVEDLAKIFVKLCEINIKSTCINIASDDTRSLKDMINEMKEVTKSKSKLLYGAISYNSNGYLSLNPSNNKLKKLIPDIKFTSFKEGVYNVMKAIKQGELL